MAPGPSPSTATAPAPHHGLRSMKLVMLGDAAVGKSSLVQRFVADTFSNDREPTIGAAFVSYLCDLGDRRVKLEIWDTAGQERFHALAPMYYRNTDAAVVAYDITNAASFARAKQWQLELRRNGPSNIVVALVGTKLDQEAARQVPAEEASAYADKHGLLFTETSARDNINVADLFYLLASKLPPPAPCRCPRCHGSSVHLRSTSDDVRAARRWWQCL
jgi:Ras-related protein Rab-5C